MEEAHGLTLLTGATGYVGGRLLERLESAAIPVRCMARRPENLASRVADTTEVVRGDVFDRDSLARAMTGVSTAYYLVHSMSDEGNFEVMERKAAGCSVKPHEPRAFGESSIWVDLALETNSRRTSKRARKLVGFCANRAFRHSSCAPRSSSARAVSPSR